MNLWPFHHRKKTNIASVPQTQSGIQLQSAAAAIAIPILYGQARIAGNLIHYNGVSTTVEQIVLSQTRAMVAMAICEGPIHDVINTWFDKQFRNKTDLTNAGFVWFLGTLTQSAWGFLTTNFPSEAVPYELTAYMACPSWPLKVGSSLPNFNWEVQGLLQWNLAGGILDANPKDVVTDFLTDANHGALFPAAQIASLTTFRDYCTATGLFLSPVFTAQLSAAQQMLELVALANSAFVWSDGLLKVIPYGDTAVTGNGVTYTPNVTPLYNLTDDDFLVSSPGDDPILVTRKPQADAYNHVQIQFENRAKAYNIDIAEAKDQTSIELTGLRTAPVMNAPAVKDAAVARFVVQLALQRQVYIRNTYEFTLGLRYVLLEPMDLVTLTDANLGLAQTTVRITKIEEQDDSTFLVTAEEWPFGVAHAALYGTPSDVGAQPNIPGITNPPVVAVSFDSTGQAILNLTGDKTTVEHIYVLRTDRVPTLAETRAGTALNFQTGTNIATGTIVAAGGAVFVGDLTYNMWGDESALVTAVFRREGSGVSAPPVPTITPLNTEVDETIWNFSFDATAGSGGGGTNLTYTIKSKSGIATFATLSSGNATAFPLTLGVTRHARVSAVIVFTVTDTATGLSASVTWMAPSQRMELDSTGRIQRANPWSDGGYAVKASDTGGSSIDMSVGDSRGYAINTHFNTGHHSFDDVPDGVTTYKKTLATRVNLGRPVIDFTEGIHTGKSLANVDSTANTKLGGIAAGADVTSANTSAAVGGAQGTKLAGIATGADVTGSNTSADTSAVNGVAASTVRAGGAKADAGLYADGSVRSSWQLCPVNTAGGWSRLVISSSNRSDMLPGNITSSGHTISVGSFTLICGDVANGEKVVNYIAGTCSDVTFGLNYVYSDDSANGSGWNGGAVTYLATTLQSVLTGAPSHIYIGKITTTSTSGTGSVGGGPICVAPETMILVCDSQGRHLHEKRADQVNLSDYVWTQPDRGRQVMGAHRVVIAATHPHEVRSRVVFEDGRVLVCSCMHRVKLMAGGWSEAQLLTRGERVLGNPIGTVESVTRILDIGPVVQLKVRGARTYISNGLLSHNMKAF